MSWWTLKSSDEVSVIEGTSRSSVILAYNSFGRVEVVDEGGDGRNTRDGALSQVDWAEADDTIDVVETGCLGGGAEGLRGHSEATVGNL